MNYKTERLSEKIEICVSEEHRFGTDAFLLADFSAPKKGALCCDLGTGCGIIPLLFCRNFSPKEVYGVDIQPQAIDQFEQSVALSELSIKVTPILSDLKELHDMPFGQFDLVCCNPPYKISGNGILSSSEADILARHETSCTIDDIAAAASRLLQYNGRLCVCQRPERLYDVMEAMRRHKLEPKRVRLVCKDSKSAPWLVLIEGNKSAKPFLKIEPSLFVYENGEYTDEMKAVYRGAIK